MGERVNIDGTLSDTDGAHIPVTDRGFLYGDSVYEVIRTYGGRLFAADSHLDRLQRSAMRLGITLPARTWLEEQMEATLRSADNAESYVRLIVTRGSGPITLDPTRAVGPRTVILVQELVPFPDWMYERGIRVTIPQASRSPRSAGDPAAKTGNYLHSVLALGEARQGGFDDALLLDARGRVAEATTANLFMAKDGTLATPSLETGLLAGVTRGLIIELARSAGIAVTEGELSPEDLYGADEVMLTSTLREVLPVVAIDSQTIGAGRPGPMAVALRQQFSRRVAELLRD